MTNTNPTGSNIPRVSSETKFEEIGQILRSNGFSLNIEFGLNGYEVIVTDIKSDVEYVEFSQDLLDAIKKALQKAFSNKKDPKLTREEHTIPATPKSKLSIKEISKLLASGEEKKIKF